MFKFLKILFTPKCKHPFWTQVDAEGIQYCVQCNEAKRLKPLELPVCTQHNWEYNKKDHLLTCKNCGALQCFHKWELSGTINILEHDDSKVPMYRLNKYHCVYCGEYKQVKSGV
jgi:uncharacterized protein YbaR (Trm112 family)